MATDAEKRLIEIDEKTFTNDMDGALQLANQLVEMEPNSPRALLRLASIQNTMGNVEEARATMLKATVLAPNFFTAHVQLGNSYLLTEPRDLSQAQAHMQRVVELEPNLPGSHDLLGDTYRALGDFESAKAHYTQAVKLDPANASSPLQQRGHVNSFLGDYDAARADYDSAIALARGNAKASFAAWRAFVHVHAGNPQAAIDELNALVSAIDGMGVPEPTGQKINALRQVAVIAMHIGDYPAAAQALEQRTALLMMQADQVGTDEFRRGREANAAYFDGILAARRGDYATATAKAKEFAALVEADANPRRLEGMHEMMGMITLLQGENAEAIVHFQQGNLNNVYTKYQLALAHEGAGNTERAKELFGEVADYNFNNVACALVRAEATAKR
jgi:tetratricopeptide (TPR) repeat protein